MSAVPKTVPLRASHPSVTPRVEPAARRVLRLVPPLRSHAAKTPFVVVLVTVLIGGLLGLLLLNTLVAQGSFALHDLARKAKDLQQREQDLAAQVQAYQAPNRLADAASKLGMVPGGPPAFLRLPAGQVLGEPVPGKAPAPPPAPSAAASASPTTSTAGSAQTAPRGSTTWTAPRQTPAPPGKGTHR